MQYVNIASYMGQTLCHSLVLRNEETFVIECDTWQVNVVMATVNLDYVALCSALPACVCVCTGREKELFNGASKLGRHTHTRIRAAGSNLRMVRPSLSSVVKLLIICAQSARQKFGPYYF